MKEEKFKAIQFIREFIVQIDRELENFPKKDIEIKNRIRNKSFDILELSYEANTTTDKMRKKELLEEVISAVKTIDFMINLSYDKKLISDKKYAKLGNKLNDIIKYISGWLKAVNAEISRA